MGEAPRKIEPANGLDELKTLLFQNEEKRLAAVETRVSRIDGRVGDAPHLGRGAIGAVVVDIDDFPRDAGERGRLMRQILKDLLLVRGLEMRHHRVGRKQIGDFHDTPC